MYNNIVKHSSPKPEVAGSLKPQNGSGENSINESTEVPPRNILLYIDHSNVFETARKHSARLKNYLPGIVDVACRIDVGKLVCKAVGNRRLLFGKLYGSEPPALDAVWDAIRKKDVEVKTFIRSKWTNREKEVDGSLTADAVEDIVQEKEKAGENRTLILFSGDRDLNQVVNKALKHEYRVEIWAFKRSLNNAVIKAQKDNPFKIQINFIDDVFKQITFTSWTWGKPHIPPERSLVAILSISQCNESKRDAILKEFVTKAGEIFRMPIVGKYLNNCDHLALIPCLRECRDKPRHHQASPEVQAKLVVTCQGVPSSSPTKATYSSTSFNATSLTGPRWMPRPSDPRLSVMVPFGERFYPRSQSPQPRYCTNQHFNNGPIFRGPQVGGPPPFPRFYPGDPSRFSDGQPRSFPGPSMGPYFNQSMANSRPAPFQRTDAGGPFRCPNVGFPSWHPNLRPSQYSNMRMYQSPTNIGPFRDPNQRPFFQGPPTGHHHHPVSNTRPYTDQHRDPHLNLPSGKFSPPPPPPQTQVAPLNAERNYDFYIHIQPKIPRLQESFKNICSLILPWNEYLAGSHLHNSRTSILTPNRFQQLKISGENDDDDDDGDDNSQEADLESNDQSYSQKTESNSDFEVTDYTATTHASSGGGFTPFVRKYKPKRILYSDYCIYKFWCRKGKLCAYKHLEEEREFFELCKNPNQRIMYKTKLCFAEVSCKYIDKPYLCPYAHGLEESRCIYCRGQGNGKHWMDECPDKKY